MATTREDAIRKAMHLFEMAARKEGNAEEAAVAAARAQEILDKYELTRAMIEEAAPEQAEPDEDIEDFGRKGAILDQVPKFWGQTWPMRLCMALCDANGCMCYLQHGDKRSFAIVGRPSDVSKIRYLWQLLTAEVIRLGEKHGKGCGGKWVRNFQIGIVDTVTLRLQQQHKATQDAFRAEATSSTALVKVEKAIAKVEARKASVALWVKQNLKLGKGVSYNAGSGDYEARAYGREVGKSVTWGNASGALGNGNNGTGLARRGR